MAGVALGISNDEINDLVKRLDRFKNRMTKAESKELRDALKKNGKKYLDSVKSKAPEHDRNGPVKRYSTAKVIQGERAAKGKGNVVAKYYKGNLKRSMRTLYLRKTNKVVMGPKVAKTAAGAKGEFKNSRRTDAYYAYMVVKGTKHYSGDDFITRAWQATKGPIAQGIERDMGRFVEKMIKRYGENK